MKVIEGSFVASGHIYALLGSSQKLQANNVSKTVILNFLADENQVWWFKVVSCALAVIGNVFFPAITGAGNVGAGFVAIVGAVLGFVVGCVESPPALSAGFSLWR